MPANQFIMQSPVLHPPSRDDLKVMVAPDGVTNGRDELIPMDPSLFIMRFGPAVHLLTSSSATPPPLFHIVHGIRTPRAQAYQGRLNNFPIRD